MRPRPSSSVGAKRRALSESITRQSLAGKNRMAGSGAVGGPKRGASSFHEVSAAR